VSQLVAFSRAAIPDRKTKSEERSLRFVDERMLAVPAVALDQVKKEMDYMLGLVEDNIVSSFTAVGDGVAIDTAKLTENEAVIDFTNSALTRYLIKLSAEVDRSDEATIGAYFHVLNDLERIGDHAENFYEIADEMTQKELTFTEAAREELRHMCGVVLSMFAIAKDAFENGNPSRLHELTALEESVDELKKSLTASHFARLAEGSCSVDHSPYYSSTVAGLERVADHLVNVGYSIVDPTGSQKSLA
jgi:phosphate:Na+ symporter